MNGKVQTVITWGFAACFASVLYPTIDMIDNMDNSLGCVIFAVLPLTESGPALCAPAFVNSADRQEFVPNSLALELDSPTPAN